MRILLSVTPSSATAASVVHANSPAASDVRHLKPMIFLQRNKRKGHPKLKTCGIQLSDFSYKRQKRISWLPAAGVAMVAGASPILIAP
jgi:hypothetical protein